MKKKILLSCVIIEFIILAILAVRIVRAPRTSVTVPHSDFTATTYMDEKDGGWYVDADYPLPEDGLFVFTPETAMDAGVYEITVNYKTDSEQNYSTVEFRIFRGTLKHNALIAALELVNEICGLAMHLTEDEIAKMSWSEFVETIEAPELIQYLKERRLYINEETNTEEDL